MAEGTPAGILSQDRLQTATSPPIPNTRQVGTQQGTPRVPGDTVSLEPGFLMGANPGQAARPRLQQEQARLGHQKTIPSEISGGNRIGGADQGKAVLSGAAAAGRAQSLAVSHTPSYLTQHPCETLGSQKIA